jgi:hypothetical protein
LLTVQQLRNGLTEFINDRIVKVLLDMNFDISDGVYARFKFCELTHERKLETLDRYNSALTAQSLTKTKGDEEFLRTLLGAPKLPDDVPAVGTDEAKVADYERKERNYRARVFWPRLEGKKKAA